MEDLVCRNQEVGTELTKVYVAPSIEEIEVKVEQGFDVSGSLYSPSQKTGDDRSW